jgi:hypothetical protein
LKILVDVHVYIDVLTKRAGWEESVRVLHLARTSHETPKTWRAVASMVMREVVLQA